MRGEGEEGGRSVHCPSRGATNVEEEEEREEAEAGCCGGGGGTRSAQDPAGEVRLIDSLSLFSLSSFGSVTYASTLTVLKREKQSEKPN